MAEPLLDAGGLVIPPSALTITRAKKLVELLGRDRLCYAGLVECRRDDGDKPTETVVIEVEVERPRDLAYPIERFEQVAVRFSEDDNWYPEVLALRADFPRVPHLNLRPKELPRSLCLYDQPWAQIALRWTPAAFIERIRFWLSETARGTLHQADQPLEPLLFGSGARIILPVDLFSDLTGNSPHRLNVRLANKSWPRTLIATRPGEDDGKQEPPDFVATTFLAKSQAHGIIRHSPANLAELHEFLGDGGIDLVSELRARSKQWGPSLAGALPIIIVAFPLTRGSTGSVEASSIWAFRSTKTVGEVGVAIGISDSFGGMIVPLAQTDESLRGQDVPIEVLEPIMAFSRAGAASANGIEADQRKIVAIGAGALGSQVVSLLGRAGFGTWTVVDEDDLLPHNLARHVLDAYSVGHPKALGVALHLNRLYKEDSLPGSILANYLAPGAWGEKLQVAMSEAEVILDMAASIPVARAVSHADYPGRRISVFLNPQGTDVVVLTEDKARTRMLTDIEGQYYRAAASDSRLKGHLESNQGRLRYGRSCRDISSTMPGHLITIHSGIASAAIRSALASEDASIRVWRCDPQSLAVTPIDVAVSGTQRRTIRGWSLVLDDDLLVKLSSLRASSLPNETGGVLLGTFDFQRMVVHVLDTIPSPPDSEEWPTLYIRGSEGLLEKVNEALEASGGQLEYIGEWHSHPDRCPTRPSGDDLKVFAWLSDHMTDAGLPTLMAIVGENGGSSWYFDEAGNEMAWDVSHAR